jgi:GAF domain-containing protein
MADAAAREILLAGARALAREDGLEPSLQIVLDAIAEAFELDSAVIVIASEAGGLEVVATFGLGDAAAAGLAEDIRRGEHPIAKAFGDPTPSLDFRPAAPGGPALRSHLPLIVTRGETDRVVGILALAHDHPLDPELRPVLEAGADLAAVAIERDRPG